MILSSHHEFVKRLFATYLVGVDEGLKHESSIHCDELVSLPKSVLTNFVGTLSSQKIHALNKALALALDLPE